MSNWWRDVRYGLRMLARNKGFTTVTVLALAFGIGPNTAIFSVVWATLLAPLPYPQYERLVVVWTKFKGDRNASPANDYLAYKSRSRSFSSLAFSAWEDIHLTSPTGAPEEIRGSRSTPGLLSKYLGEKMSLGRDFLPEEAKAGNDRVAILTHRLWLERYHADPKMLGKQIRIEDKAYTVVGVRPAGPADRGDGGRFDIPLALTPENGYQY